MITENLYDACIRPSLCAMLRSQHKKCRNTLIVEELGLCRGQVRVDVALINGIMHGYEIKSDRDSLKRLLQQSEMYNRIFDKITLVVGARHYEKAFSIIPEWWGVMKVEDGKEGVTFELVRAEHHNPIRDSRAIVELLWLDEAMELLEKKDAAKGVRSKPRKLVWDRISEVLSIDEISEKVRECLKARKGIQYPELSR